MSAVKVLYIGHEGNTTQINIYKIYHYLDNKEIKVARPRPSNDVIVA